MNMMYYPEGSEDALSVLVRVSREFGQNPDYVLAGGGNTSCKIKDLMYVKASGTSLATIEADGFTAIDMKKLSGIWDAKYPEDKDAREDAVLKDLMASRLDPEGRRPSVETLLHGLFPYTYVFHTHPALVNGLTCSIEGEKAARELFGDSAIWIPVIDPGYILAKAVRDTIEIHREKTGLFPQLVFLQNHGVFVAADTIEEVRKLYHEVFDVIVKRLGNPEKKVFDAVVSDGMKELKSQFSSVFKEKFTAASYAGEFDELLKSEETFAPMASSITPDHIVYSGYRPLWIEDINDLEKEVKLFEENEQFFPRVIAVKNTGVLACHDSESKADTALQLFRDNRRIVDYASGFGGISFMPKENVDFIRNWEVEKYRASQSK